MSFTQRDAASDVVTFAFPLVGGRVVVATFPWVAGKTIRSYFKDPQLASYHPTGRRMNNHMSNQRNENLRLVSVPRPGDKITFTKRPW
jgi:hypothetical protein